MANKIDIVNMALVRLEISETLQDLGTDTPITIRVKTHWDGNLDCVLSEHPWGFASRTDALALLAGTAFGWGYAYAYPHDCVAMRRLFEYPGGQPAEYEVGRLKAHKAILTNAGSVVAKYTAPRHRCRRISPVFRGSAGLSSCRRHEHGASGVV